MARPAVPEDSRRGFCDTRRRRGNVRLAPAVLSSWNSLTGLRPTPGLGESQRHVGWTPCATAQMGSMTRTVTIDLAKMLDVMVGYDPEDPITATGLAHTPKTYTAFLDKNGLKGARIGVIREPIGALTDPTTTDFKMIDEAFERTSPNSAPPAPSSSITSSSLT
ncbi:MAG: amidase family protein [Nibricoccus sp.]